MGQKVLITVWSDYVCPFCYLEEPVLERIQKAFDGTVNLQWRAFELRPNPVPTLDPDGEYLHSTWERSVYPMAERRKMTLRLPPVQPRSRRALEMAAFAREEGLFEKTHHALFKAFFEDGRNLNDVGVLLEVGATVGLDVERLKEALEERTYRDQVLTDEKLAREIGVNSVPTLLVGQTDKPLDQAEPVVGAQPFSMVKAAVERALA